MTQLCKAQRRHRDSPVTPFYIRDRDKPPSTNQFMNTKLREYTSYFTLRTNKQILGKYTFQLPIEMEVSIFRSYMEIAAFFHSVTRLAQFKFVNLELAEHRGNGLSPLRRQTLSPPEDPEKLNAIDQVATARVDNRE